MVSTSDPKWTQNYGGRGEVVSRENRLTTNLGRVADLHLLPFPVDSDSPFLVGTHHKRETNPRSRRTRRRPRKGTT